MKIRCFILLLILVFSERVIAQTFDPFSLFGKGKLFKLNGGVNASMLYNYSSNTTQGGNPFNYVIGANFNIYVKGINIPLDFTYSNAQFSYRFQPVPLNRIAIHPKYKIYTLHAGSIALTLSPYTLNGAQFNGAGVEIAPRNWKIMVLGGKFLRGSGDFLLNPEAQPTYERWGKGLGISHQFKNHVLGVNFFHAKEDTLSAFNFPVESGITPKENIVSSLGGSGSIKGIKYSFEVANSLLTDNLNVPNAFKSKNLLARFIGNNGSTKSNNATNARLNYLFEKMQFHAGLSFERVDFNYQTLGSLYNINGFQNIGVTANKIFLGGKVSLNGQVGLQNDVGDDTTISQKSNRLLATINANFNPIQQLSFNASYSNTRGVTNIRNLNNIANQNNLVPQFLDSLRLVQLNQNANFSANYQITSTPEKNNSANFNFSYQKGDQRQGEFFVDIQGTKFYNASLNYYTVLPKVDTRWSFGLNYSKTSQGVDSNNVRAVGFNFNFGKKFFKRKLAFTIGSGYNTTSMAASASGVNIINFRSTASYVMYKKHVFNFNAIFQIQSKTRLGSPQTNTSTGAMGLTYNYNF
ncbi:MAG: hypothetical protein EAZ41_00675 [Sphingobacteriia bacterium]|nr:MAG: hypothetical protein EAZ41_00675 [Sphingobacteriia bacterium]